MAELVYALALGASGAILESPSLSACTGEFLPIKKEVKMSYFEKAGVRCKELLLRGRSGWENKGGKKNLNMAKAKEEVGNGQNMRCLQERR